MIFLKQMFSTKRSWGRWFFCALTALLLTSFGIDSWAQKVTEPYDQDDHNKGYTDLMQSGSLFRIQIAPNQRELLLQVAGNDAVKVKSQDTRVEATYGLGDSKKKLSVEKVVDQITGRISFVLKRDSGQPIENLELNVRSGNHSERFTVPKVP